MKIIQFLTSKAIENLEQSDHALDGASKVTYQGNEIILYIHAVRPTQTATKSHYRKSFRINGKVISLAALKAILSGSSAGGKVEAEKPAEAESFRFSPKKALARKAKEKGISHVELLSICDNCVSALKVEAVSPINDKTVTEAVKSHLDSI